MLHQALYFDAPTTASITDAPGLSHWVLYEDIVALPDPIFGWAVELLAATEMATFGTDPDDGWYQSKLFEWAVWIKDIRPLLAAKAVAPGASLVDRGYPSGAGEYSPHFGSNCSQIVRERGG